MTIKSTLIGSLAVVAAFVALPTVGHADLLFVTDLDNGSGSLPIPGNQAWGGQLGDDFTTTTNISLNSIGVFDSDGDGTFGDLVWQLFDVGTGTLVHEQTITASGARAPGSTIEDNYLWAQLSTSLDLLAGNTYSVVAYGFDATDMNFNTNMNLGSLDVAFNSTGIISGGGRYSNGASSSLPTLGAGNAASVQAYNFGAATFTYAAGVPEPATLGLLGIGLLGIGALSRRRK